MAGKSITIFKLTPAQIDLVERLAKDDGQTAMGDLSYGEVLAYQALQKLGLPIYRWGDGRSSGLC